MIKNFTHSRSFLLFSFSFRDSAIHTISWLVTLCIECEGTGAGSSYSHRNQLVRIVYQFEETVIILFVDNKGLDHLFMGKSKDIAGL